MAEQRDVMRRTYPAGVPCWVDTGQPDVEAAMHFYGGVFGWEFHDTAPAGGMGSGTGRYVIATLAGQEAAAITGHGSGIAAWNTYVSVDEADAAVRHLLAVGATLKSAPAGVRSGGIQAVLEDPEGVESSAFGRPGSDPAPRWSTVRADGISVTSTQPTPRQPSPSTRRPSAGSSTTSTSE